MVICLLLRFNIDYHSNLRVPRKEEAETLGGILSPGKQWGNKCPFVKSTSKGNQAFSFCDVRLGCARKIKTNPTVKKIVCCNRNMIVLHNMVCRDCNQYFGNTLDNTIARGSMQGVIRYFRGIRSLKKFRDIDKERVRLSACAQGQAALRQAEFVETPEGEGLAFTPGISYQSISKRKEEFISLESLERGKWKKPGDVNKDQPVIISYRNDDILERIKQALARLNLGVEILDTIDITEVGQRVLVVVDAVKEDILLQRAIAKIAFNYLAYKMREAFLLQPIFDKTRAFIRQGSKSNTLVKRIPPMKIFGDHEEAKCRRGHIVAVELSADGTTIVGFVEFFGVMTYKVTLGRFGQLAIPISAGHYFDVKSKQVLQMDAIRPSPGLWTKISEIHFDTHENIDDLIVVVYHLII